MSEPTRASASASRSGAWIEPAIAGSVIAIATLFLFAPLFAGALMGAPRFFEWDVPEQYWGDLVFLCRSLHEGELPYWNPYDRGGYPYYADPQASLYHPLAWGICAVAGPSPGLGWQEARVVLGFVVAGVFGLLWLRRLGASWHAASVGAVVIEAAPFMRHNWELNLTSALGWLPMVLWAFERLLALRRPRDIAVLAVAEALLVWSGSPPAAWFAGSFTAIYVVFRVIEIGRAEGRSALITVGPMLGLAVILTIGLCAAVLVPGLTLSHHSVQAGRSFESLAEGGLTLEDASAIVWPRDGNHLYVGWLALALAPLAWWRAVRLPGRTVLALSAIIAVLLALGAHGPLFGVAFDAVPGVRLFRLPHRYEAWLGPALGALAAGGLDALRERLARSPAQRLAMPAGALFVLGVGWLAVGTGLAPAALALGGAVILGASLARTQRAWSVASIALALLVLVDVSQRLPDERHTRLRPAPGGDDVAERVLARAPDTDVRWRYLDEFGISCRSGTRLGRRDFRGYQDPLLLSAYERVMAGLAEHPELAMQFNVRFALTGPHFIHGWNRHYLPPPDVLRSLEGVVDRGEGVLELTRAMPLAYVVPASHVEHVLLREDALARVVELAPAPIAIVEAEREQAARDTGAEIVEARVTSYGTDAITLEVEPSAGGTLIVNEAWYPGWRAWVDGREARVRRANGLVRAVDVPAGLHEVTLRFEPGDGPPLRWLLIASWVAVLALAFARWRPRRAEKGVP